MFIVPTARPEKFRDDVVAVARKGDASIPEVARDFGISESCLRNWAVQGRCRGRPSARRDREGVGELRELRPRNRLLEQENEVLRRAAAYLSQANLPENEVPARP